MHLPILKATWILGSSYTYIVPHVKQPPQSRRLSQSSRLESQVIGSLQVASYMRAVLRTIAQCHANKILHRDVKPGNFMLLEDDPLSPVKAIGQFSPPLLSFCFDSEVQCALPFCLVTAGWKDPYFH